MIQHEIESNTRLSVTLEHLKADGDTARLSISGHTVAMTWEELLAITALCGRGAMYLAAAAGADEETVALEWFRIEQSMRSPSNGST